MRNCHNMTNFNFKSDNYLDYSTLCVYVFMLVYRMNRIEFGIWTERNEKKGITKYNVQCSTSVGNVWPWKKLELCEKKSWKRAKITATRIHKSHTISVSVDCELSTSHTKTDISNAVQYYVFRFAFCFTFFVQHSNYKFSGIWFGSIYHKSQSFQLINITIIMYIINLTLQTVLNCRKRMNCSLSDCCCWVEWSHIN